MSHWFDILAPSVVATVCAFQFTYFATKKELMKLESQIREIEKEQTVILKTLAEISAKLDMLLKHERRDS